MTDGLKEQYRAEIRSVFAACPKVSRALLFGSRAKGKFRRDSDIDFALEGDRLVFSDIAFLNSKFEESNVPFDVDILIRANISSPDLEQQIAQQGTEFYKKSGH
jgi:predicted nucleotidyltransferase